MIIRPFRDSDTAQICAINADPSVKRSMNISGTEFKYSEKRLKNLSVLDHMLVLETETPPAEICAVLLLQVNPQIYLRRLATIEIMVSSKLQGQGLGKALMHAAMELADKELMLERIEVEISVENFGALKLFKSFGFKVEGTAKDWAMSEDGGYMDAYLLARCRPVKG